MKRQIISLVALASLMVPSFALATTWTIDPDHSSIGFKVRHMMVSNVKGNFEKFSGTIQVDDMDISKSKIDVTIDTNSINTNVAKRDTHLRSGDFFDVAKYPTMTFTSKKIDRLSPNQLKVTGDLTLHGVTREVILNVEGPAPESKDPWGNTRSGATATATINRKDFGLTYNAVLETGGVAVGEEVAIALEIELIKGK